MQASWTRMRSLPTPTKRAITSCWFNFTEGTALPKVIPVPTSTSLRKKNCPPFLRRVPPTRNGKKIQIEWHGKEANITRMPGSRRWRDDQRCSFRRINRRALDGAHFHQMDIEVNIYGPFSFTKHIPMVDHSFVF